MICYTEREGGGRLTLKERSNKDLLESESASQELTSESTELRHTRYTSSVKAVVNINTSCMVGN